MPWSKHLSLSFLTSLVVIYWLFSKKALFLFLPHAFLLLLLLGCWLRHFFHFLLLAPESCLLDFQLIVARIELEILTMGSSSPSSLMEARHRCSSKNQDLIKRILYDLTFFHKDSASSRKLARLAKQAAT